MGCQLVDVFFRYGVFLKISWKNIKVRYCGEPFIKELVF
jgi:hypothetical protein